MSIAVPHGLPASAPPPPPEPAPAKVDYLNVSHTIWSWLFTIDHKRIGILYLISITVFFLAGGIAAGLVRLNLLGYEASGHILRVDSYKREFTAQGVMMLFFF